MNEISKVHRIKINIIIVVRKQHKELKSTNNKFKLVIKIQVGCNSNVIDNFHYMRQLIPAQTYYTTSTNIHCCFSSRHKIYLFINMHACHVLLSFKALNSSLVPVVLSVDC